jgi:catechol 2,3-dioxygenase-like lactoylglutathione lyase family enzyme
MFTQCNVTLMVADMDRAVRFYTEGLGLELGYRAGNEWAQVSGPGLTIGLHPAGDHFSHQQAPDGRISIGFQVPKVDEAITQLRDRGVEITAEIRDGGVDRIVNFVDPDGTPLYLIELPSY